MLSRVAATIESTVATATNIRKRPSVTAPIVGNLRNGTAYSAVVNPLLVFDEQGSKHVDGSPLEWYSVDVRVGTNQIIGYVAEPYVKVTFENQPPKEPRYWVDLLGMTVEVSESTLQEVIPLLERILEGLKQATKVGE
jgi:hypothetical protein